MIEAEIMEIVARRLKKDIATLTPETNLKKDLGADSIDSVEVVFDKSFDPSIDFMSKLEGLNIIVAHEYIGAIQGSTLDYVTEGMNSHFELVNNPNEKARCGCGESFTI